MKKKNLKIDEGRLLDLWLLTKGHTSDSLRKIEIGHMADLLRLQSLGVIGFAAEAMAKFYPVAAMSNKVRFDKLFPGLAAVLGVDKESVMDRKKKGGDEIMSRLEELNND